jgi:hypothetical protein
VAEADRSRDVRFHMSLGRSWAKVSKTFTGRSRFDMSCENAVAGVRGTVWRMNVDSDQSAMVRVYDGEVNVAGGRKTMDEIRSQVKPSMRLTAPKPIAGPHKVSMEEWTYIVRSLQEIRIDRTVCRRNRSRSRRRRTVTSGWTGTGTGSGSRQVNGAWRFRTRRSESIFPTV